MFALQSRSLAKSVAHTGKYPGVNTTADEEKAAKQKTILTHFFEDVKCSQLRKVCDMYRLDFDLFGYSCEKYNAYCTP